MAVLYRHIRKDTDEVFYVGIGADVKRAYVSRNRTKHWKNIVSKAGYEVEVLFDELTWEEANEKEVEFIKLYGRKDLEEGTLVNLTDGGGGTLGFIKGPTPDNVKSKIAKSLEGRERPLEVRVKMSNTRKGKKRSEQHNFNNAVSKYKQVSKLDKNTGEVLDMYNSLKEASERSGLAKSTISRCANGDTSTAGGFVWKYKNKNNGI